jgi:hypothetical protein
LKIVREGFRLGPPLVASPDKTWAGGPANPHCSRILDSLRELQGLDDGRAVQVIYVPVSQDQGAQAVLRELLYVYYVWRGLEQNGIRPGQIDLSQRDWKDVRKDAALNASRAISNNVPLKADGANLASDKAILEALLNIATQYCEKTKRSFFVNESWTVGKSLLHVQYPEEPRGIVLAAVGNNAGIDVYQTRWDFARRSLQTNDHIAVMNAIVGDVPACDSNVVGNFTNTRAVAFNGQIAGGPCGTSFAAPRVAWLLAFSEALRPAPVDIQNWANDVQARLVTWLQTGPAGLSKYSFDFDRFANSL